MNEIDNELERDLVFDDDHEVFDTLYSINVNDRTEKKESGKTSLTYLSWPWAWAEVKKRYPDASYTIWKNPDGNPYSFDPKTGYMVWTTVTIHGITHEMWLPVMDGHNKAMKDVKYEYTTSYGKKSVEPATMFDVNKTVMRCLVKNLAMFGLGLYIYAGEDLPEGEEEAKDPLEGYTPPASNTTFYKCDKCGKDILPYTNQKTGKEFGVKEHIALSMKKFNALYCIDCINAMKDENS